MATNFPDSPSNGATHTFGGTTYTYNSTKGVWTAPAGGGVSTFAALSDTPANFSGSGGKTLKVNSGANAVEFVTVTTPSAGASVYANLAALPTSGNTQGDFAHVTSNNGLYIWNGSGWYSIAIVNATPSISGANASYVLASNGTATTVTITAADPEGLPITYSIASDTSGNIATVAQGTGASTNVWTITPSTNAAHAGTFSLVFRASDGVNIATATSAFTLEFTVTNSHYTTGLFTSVGANNATNKSTWDDKSSNDHTITAVGDVHQTTFSPYRHGGYSVYCDGNDAVKFNETAADEFTFGTGDFTMEGWFWIDYASIGASGEHTLIGNNGTDTEMWFSVIGSTWGGPKYNFQTGTGSGWSNTVSSGANTVKLRQWVHLAVVRNSGTVNIYENGVSVASGSNTINLPNTNNMLSFMGRPQTYGQYAKGYIHDVRITKGTAVYTSNFTVPDEPMSAVSNTKLLAFRKPYIVDESTSSLTFTLDTGDPEFKGFTPYDYSQYTVANNGGSAHFDGSGDYLHMPQTSLDLAASDFCVEAWVYTTSTANQAIVGSYRYADGVGSWNLNVNYNSKKLRFFIRHSSGTVLDGQFESGTFPTNQWVHVAVTRDGSNLRAFINGTQAGSTNTSIGSNTIDNAITTYRIGASNDNNILWNGNITDVRIVKGSSVYTSNFTPPTAPLTAITNTEFLFQGTEGGVIDKSQHTDTISLVGDAKCSTAQYKYLTSSMYFDGSGDYIQLDSQDIANFGTGDFTAEGWFWVSSLPGSGTIYTIVDARGSGGNTTGWTMGLNASGQIYVYSGSQIVGAGGTVSTSTWHHWAFSRASGSMKQFLNGTQVGSTSTTARDFTDTKFRIAGSHSGGELFTGYQSDVRMTKGLARYTSNFTAPTEALKG